jgi:hypothetical protein
MVKFLSLVSEVSMRIGVFDKGDSLKPLRLVLEEVSADYVRRDDWNAALVDLKAAAGIEGAGPLASVERSICRRTMAGTHGAAMDFRPPVAGRLARSAHRGAVGREIASELGGGAIWRVREALERRVPAEAARAAAFVLRAGGGRGRIGLPRPSGRSEEGGRCLRERTRFGANAYDW